MDEDDWDDTFRELLEERILRSSDAALTALSIMTTPGMPKEAVIEDTIERCIQLCKQLNNRCFTLPRRSFNSVNLCSVVFPAHDHSRRLAKKKKEGDAGDKDENSKRKKKHTHPRRITAAHKRRDHTVRTVSARMNELMGCLAELVEQRSLAESSIVQVRIICVSPISTFSPCSCQHCALNLSSSRALAICNTTRYD